MTDSSTRELVDVEWRRLTNVVWVGRRDGHHVGMIERGRAYVATDGEGVVLGRFRDLASAQASFSCPSASADGERALRRAKVWPYLAGGGLLAVVAAGTSAALLLP